MLSLFVASSGLVQSPGAVVPTRAVSAVSAKMETTADLEKLADELNPIVGYWNPLGLGTEFTFWEKSNEETIGWLRQAEIKHGRVSMAAFVGYCVQAAGLHFPGEISKGVTYESISAAGGPGDQWDALSFDGKIQIVLFVGFLEFISESTYALEKSGEKHYMRGGKPGFFPSFKQGGVVPHPVPFDLYDPFGLAGKMSPEKKAKSLLAEVNNGRLAMLGIIGVLAASKGCIVPGLDSLPIAPYAGEYMKPFADFTF